MTSRVTRNGELWVIAAPSGAGKTSLVKALIERDPTLHVAADQFDTLDPDTGIKYTWAYDTVRAGEAIASI